MFLVPREVMASLTKDGDVNTKKALASGAVRQLNNLDVRDGGRVIIRNDDHYKTLPSNSYTPTSTMSEDTPDPEVRLPPTHRVADVDRLHGVLQPANDTFDTDVVTTGEPESPGNLGAVMDDSALTSTTAQIHAEDETDSSAPQVDTPGFASINDTPQSENITGIKALGPTLTKNPNSKANRKLSFREKSTNLDTISEEPELEMDLEAQSPEAEMNETLHVMEDLESSGTVPPQVATMVMDEYEKRLASVNPGPETRALRKIREQTFGKKRKTPESTPIITADAKKIKMHTAAVVLHRLEDMGILPPAAVDKYLSNLDSKTLSNSVNVSLQEQLDDKYRQNEKSAEDRNIEPDIIHKIRGVKRKELNDSTGVKLPKRHNSSTSPKSMRAYHSKTLERQLDEKYNKNELSDSMNATTVDIPRKSQEKGEKRKRVAQTPSRPTKNFRSDWLPLTSPIKIKSGNTLTSTPVKSPVKSPIKVTSPLPKLISPIKTPQHKSPARAPIKLASPRLKLSSPIKTPQRKSPAKTPTKQNANWLTIATPATSSKPSPKTKLSTPMLSPPKSPKKLSPSQIRIIPAWMYSPEKPPSPRPKLGTRARRKTHRYGDTPPKPKFAQTHY